MRLLIVPFLLLFVCQVQASPANSPPLPDDGTLKLALVPKEGSSSFSLAIKQGCIAAARSLQNVSCIYRGSDETDVRVQDGMVLDLIEQGVDGIAVAVTQSDFLLRSCIHRAREAGIPVITFDADFDHATLASDPGARLAYVGSDNFELGYALGAQVRELLPDGGTVAIQSGRPDSPNLNLRIMGLRSALSGREYASPPGEPLRNEAGFNEFSEILYNYGNYARALDDLERVVANHKHRGIDAFVAVGGGPQFMPDYESRMEPYRADLESHSLVLVVADNTDAQLGYLREGLSHRNVGQNPYEMGRQAIFTLFKILEGQPVEAMINTPITVCGQENHARCMLFNR